MDNQTAQPVQKPLEIPAEVRTFLESILEDAGMTNLNDQTHEDMVKELFVRLDNFMLTTIVEALPTNKIAEFTKMSETGKSKEELENYLKNNIPNSDEVFSRAMLQFRDLYLGNAAIARNIPTTDQST